jgi:hypothetical protein
MTQSRRNRWIMGSAISLAALAVAIDHTRHPVPSPVAAQTSQQAGEETTPCSLGDSSEQTISPCSLGEDSEEQTVSPCSL